MKPRPSSPPEAQATLLESLQRREPGARGAAPGGPAGAASPCTWCTEAGTCSGPRPAAKLGEAVARRALAEYAPGCRARSTRRWGWARSPSRGAMRVVAKLAREPVEDFRIDFEDGYGTRPDAEEDRDAARSRAREVAQGHRGGTLPRVHRHPHQAARPRNCAARRCARCDIFLADAARRRRASCRRTSWSRCPRSPSLEQVEACSPTARGARAASSASTPACCAFEVMVETPQVDAGCRTGGSHAAAPDPRRRRPACRPRTSERTTTPRIARHHRGAPAHAPPGVRLRQARDAGGVRGHRRAGSPDGSTDDHARGAARAATSGATLLTAAQQAREPRRRARARGGCTPTTCATRWPAASTRAGTCIRRSSCRATRAVYAFFLDGLEPRERAAAELRGEGRAGDARRRRVRRRRDRAGLL